MNIVRHLARCTRAYLKLASCCPGAVCRCCACAPPDTAVQMDNVLYIRALQGRLFLHSPSLFLCGRVYDGYPCHRRLCRDLKAAADLAVEDEELAAELDMVVDSLLDRFEYGRSDMMILSALLHPKYRCVWGGCCSKVQHQIVRGNNLQHCMPYQHCMHPQKPF